MAQSVEHILGKDEVGGSSPLSSSRKRTTHKGGAFFEYDFYLKPPSSDLPRGKDECVILKTAQCAVLPFEVSLRIYIAQTLTETAVFITAVEKEALKSRKFLLSV